MLNNPIFDVDITLRDAMYGKGIRDPKSSEASYWMHHINTTTPNFIREAIAKAWQTSIDRRDKR